MNSFSEKIDSIKTMLPGNIDIMIFMIGGFLTPYRFDRNRFGGGHLIYAREDIPSKQINDHKFDDGIEGIFVEVNLRKTTLLIFGTYHPPSQDDKFYFDNIGKALELYNNKYDKVLLAGDFNAEVKETILMNFLELYNLRNLVADKTCFKSIMNQHVLISSLQPAIILLCTKTISTGVSDFHKIILTVLKTTFKKSPPKVKLYRSFKTFDDNKFKNDPRQKLHSNCEDFCSFEASFLEVLNAHAPLKKRVIRANEVPYDDSFEESNSNQI